MKQTLLIVDRDLTLAKIIGTFFILQNFSCVFAKSVREALLKIERQKFNCILLDPSFDSDDAGKILYHMKNSENLNKTTPVVIATYDMDQYVEADASKVIKCVLPKPFELMDLYQAVQSTQPISAANLN